MKTVNVKSLIVLFVVMAIGLAACGGNDETADSGSTGGDCGELTPVTIQLQWVTQSQFAGYYAAKAKGFYRDAELVPREIILSHPPVEEEHMEENTRPMCEGRSSSRHIRAIARA